MIKKILVVILLGLSLPAFAKKTSHTKPPRPPAGYFQCYASNVSGATWYVNHPVKAKAMKKALRLCQEGSPRVVNKTCHTKPIPCVRSKA